jgi:LPXTG-motif cell wall-anchored protein
MKMKTMMKTLFGLIFCISLMGSVNAQEGTYVEEVKDSSYVEDLFMDEEEGATESSNTVLYIAIAAVLIGGGIFLARKKKK